MAVSQSLRLHRGLCPREAHCSDSSYIHEHLYPSACPSQYPTSAQLACVPFEDSLFRSQERSAPSPRRPLSPRIPYPNLRSFRHGCREGGFQEQDVRWAQQE
eukprot:8328077-Pyramimonas_sp.AAC.1